MPRLRLPSGRPPLFASALAIAGLSGVILHAGQTIAAANVRVGLQRTECFGTCPVYTVTITGDGTVEYEGTRHVGTVGTRTDTIPGPEVVALVNEFLGAWFFDARSEYAGREMIQRRGQELVVSTMTVADLPSAILTLQLGDRTKTVVLRDGYPAELGRLPELVDRAARTERWTAGR